MKILCFGDSNTYGYIPGGGRYDKRTRWPGQLQRLLGESFRVVEEGMNGRTTVFEDGLFPGRCGLNSIDTPIELYGPFDLLIIMLGTNDCKIQFHASAKRITEGLEEVLRRAKSCMTGACSVLIIAPTPMSEKAAHGVFGMDFDETSVKTSGELAGEYEMLAQRLGCDFLDAAKVTPVGSVDGVHLDAAGHEALAAAVARYLKSGKLAKCLGKSGEL